MLMLTLPATWGCGRRHGAVARSSTWCSRPHSPALCPPPPPPAGDGWSPRAEDAVLHGCIPVIIMDEVHAVYESIIDWDGFSVRGLAGWW
jgi:hypothetical protein